MNEGDRHIQVIKFGGVLMGTPENIIASANYVHSLPIESGILSVVSAASGVTDTLVELSDALAQNTNPEAQRLADEFYTRYEALISQVGLGSITRNNTLQELYTSYQNILLFKGIERFRPGMRDSILSQGEHMSATLFTGTLKETGVPVKKIEAEEVIFTDAQFGNASPDLTRTSAEVRRVIGRHLQNGRRAVLPGFYGRDADGRTTVMKRNTSDMTGALGAHGLNAQVLKLAKGIAGVYDKDPHKHTDAQHLQWLSYDQATEISNNGGKVVHPDVMPLMRKKAIPIIVFDPRNLAQQTVISETFTSPYPA